MNAPIVAIRLLLPAALLVAACGVQPHPTVSANGTAGTDAVSGVAGTTGQGGTGHERRPAPAALPGRSEPPARREPEDRSIRRGEAARVVRQARAVRQAAVAAPPADRARARAERAPRATVGTGTAGTGGTGTSGAGITINGTFVPKEKAITFIHFGHSNMRGQATKPSSLMTYFYSTQAGLWSYKGSFTLAKEPTAPEGTMTLAGPGMAILHSAQGALQAGSDAQIISIGYGKGSVTTVDYAKTGVYYPIFMNWAQQLKGKVTFAGIVVMLGITERHLPTDQISGFPARMTADHREHPERSGRAKPARSLLRLRTERDGRSGADGLGRNGHPAAHPHAAPDDSKPGARSHGRPLDAGRPPLRHAGAQGLGRPGHHADAVEGLVALVAR